jgi:hypothetical protein
MREYSSFELLDPLSLPAPWPLIVHYWLLHHPDRFFLPEPGEPCSYMLSWEDLRDVLIAGGVIASELTIH